MIRAILFDIDGVLLDSFEANLKFFQDLMIRTGYRPPKRDEFQSIFHLSMWDAIKALTKSESEGEIRKIWELGESREVAYPVELMNMPEGAEKAIKKLSKNYLLGIVTSRVRNGVFEVPRLAKLKKYFRVAIAYEDTENHKPHPEPLLLAAKQLGVRPEECIYVGDVENDLKAASNAGMKFILYTQDGLGGVDYRAADFKAISEIIRRL